jgi:hypothetical protein
MVRPEGLGKVKRFNVLMGTRTRNLMTCGIAPEILLLPTNEADACGKKKSKALPVTGLGGL